MNTLNLKTKFRIYPHTLLLNRNATPPSFLEIDPHSGTESNVSAPGVTALDLIARNTNTFFIPPIASIDVKKNKFLEPTHIISHRYAGAAYEGCMNP